MENCKFMKLRGIRLVRNAGSSALLGLAVMLFTLAVISCGGIRAQNAPPVPVIEESDPVGSPNSAADVPAVASAPEVSAQSGPPEPVIPGMDPPPPHSTQDVYVLDYSTADSGAISHVWVINPSIPRVLTEIQGRTSPDIGISPDRESVYVLDSWRSRVHEGDWTHALRKFDAFAGTREWEVDIPGTRVPFTGFPDQTQVIVSPSGATVFVVMFGGVSRILTFDAASGAVLAEMPTSRCGAVWLPVSESEVYSICDKSVTYLDPTTNQRNELAPLSTDASELRRVMAATSSSGPRKIWAATVIVETGISELLEMTALTPSDATIRTLFRLPDGWVFSSSHNALAASADGSRIYVGVAPEDAQDFNLAQAVWVYDGNTGKRIGVIPLPEGGFGIDVSADGALLYVVNPNSNTFTIIDTESFSTMAKIPGLGVTPIVVRAR